MANLFSIERFNVEISWSAMTTATPHQSPDACPTLDTALDSAGRAIGGPATEPGVPRRAWAAVTAVATATFAMVTLETLPVGLLTPIGASFHVSPGVAGLTVTLPGLLAAITAALLPPAIRGLDRRHVLLVWGLAFGAVPVAVQSWILRSAPDAAEAATALNTACYNLAIAVGAAAGGVVVDAAGTRAVLVLGSILAALATGVVLATLRPARQATTAASRR
jgi:predicted MFS family arabinose efflux permease